MSDLLEQAVQAHGGIDTWRKLRGVRAKLEIGGGIWHVKGQPDMFRNIELDADLRRQQVDITSPAGEWTSRFTPDVVSIGSKTERIVEDRRAPRSSFANHTQQSPWDRLHAIYFSSYALWTYLTIPFLYTLPGFETEELPQWEENGEVWRRLKVKFPASVVSHSREQISYFREDGLLRRHDYTVDVMGGASGANYASDYRDVGGIIVPMSRRVFAYDDTGRKIGEPLLVSIDFSEIEWRME
ncbi:hypothetical protein [Caballeronia glebae]|jgi:hypothetical protein|uniref:hypothetical protein n=1 Tax=Caballeronia glebae TaxID=1777143 RepID=UPI0038BBF0C7